METLTKENFWNEMDQKYPKAMANFKAWIDQYKSEHDWDILFGFDGANEHLIPKYHELPIAMQFGIFLEYTQFVYTYFIERKAIAIPIAINFDNRIPINISEAIKVAFHIMEDKL